MTFGKKLKVNLKQNVNQKKDNMASERTKQRKLERKGCHYIWDSKNGPLEWVDKKKRLVKKTKQMKQKEERIKAEKNGDKIEEETKKR